LAVAQQAGQTLRTYQSRLYAIDEEVTKDDI
jgi:hypothetical protein